jgi:hypothetical protein
MCLSYLSILSHLSKLSIFVLLVLIVLPEDKEGGGVGEHVQDKDAGDQGHREREQAVT